MLSHTTHHSKWRSKSCYWRRVTTGL
jgi:hypothetical protein